MRACRVMSFCLNLAWLALSSHRVSTKAQAERHRRRLGRNGGMDSGSVVDVALTLTGSLYHPGKNN